MAKGTATADPPVSKADVEQPVEVAEPVQEAEAPPVKRAASKAVPPPEAGTGEEGADGKEPTSEAAPEVQEPEEIKAARAAQAEADRLRFEAEQQARRAQRELDRIKAQQAQRERGQRRERLREAWREGDETALEEYLGDEDRQAQAMQAFRQYEDHVVSWSRQSAQQLYPELKPHDFDAADAEMETLAARQGREPTAAERLAMYGDYRVRPLEKQIEAKEREITDLKQQVAALQGKRTGDIVDDEDAGPDTPINGARPGRGKLYSQMTREEREAMTDAERDAAVARERQGA